MKRGEKSCAITGSPPGRGFDVGYCSRKARALPDATNWDADTLDWAKHLAELVLIVRSGDLAAKVLIARARLRRGEKEEAAAILEELRARKPESFAGGGRRGGLVSSLQVTRGTVPLRFEPARSGTQVFQSFRQSPKSAEPIPSTKWARHANSSAIVCGPRSCTNTSSPSKAIRWRLMPRMPSSGWERDNDRATGCQQRRFQITLAPKLAEKEVNDRIAAAMAVGARYQRGRILWLDSLIGNDHEKRTKHWKVMRPLRASQSDYRLGHHV